MDNPGNADPELDARAEDLETTDTQVNLENDVTDLEQGPSNIS